MTKSIGETPRYDNVLSNYDLQSKSRDVMERLGKQLIVAQHYTTEAEQRMADTQQRHVDHIITGFYPQQIRDKAMQMRVCFALKCIGAGFQIWASQLVDGNPTKAYVVGGAQTSTGLENLIKEVFENQSLHLQQLRTALDHQVQAAQRCVDAQRSASQSLETAQTRLAEARQSASAH
jgi:hypothetical protein